jgi:hypothetical protein
MRNLPYKSLQIINILKVLHSLIRCFADCELLNSDVLWAKSKAQVSAALSFAGAREFRSLLRPCAGSRVETGFYIEVFYEDASVGVVYVSFSRFLLVHRRKHNLRPAVLPVPTTCLTG